MLNSILYAHYAYKNKKKHMFFTKELWLLLSIHFYFYVLFTAEIVIWKFQSDRHENIIFNK